MQSLEPFSLLEKYGIKVAEYRIVKNLEEAREAAKALGYPLVAKVWDARYTHKTDIGGVILDIWNDRMLEESITHLLNAFNPQSILIQKQIKKGIELYAGVKWDETFGYVVLFGLGGIYVEVFKDITARICPLSKDEVYDMIDELKAKKILLGYRGKPVNIDALAEMLLKLGSLALNEGIEEMDINPLKADENGYVVIDARIKKKE